MRAVLFVNSNVIFAAQDIDPADGETRRARARVSTNPLSGAIWRMAGHRKQQSRARRSGQPAGRPRTLLRERQSGSDRQTLIGRGFVEGLRAGRDGVPYKAARSKNQDAILEATDGVVTACANCHDVYRDKGALGGNVAARCVK